MSAELEPQLSCMELFTFLINSKFLYIIIHKFVDFFELNQHNIKSKIYPDGNYALYMAINNKVNYENIYYKSRLWNDKS